VKCSEVASAFLLCHKMQPEVALASGVLNVLLCRKMQPEVALASGVLNHLCLVKSLKKIKFPNKSGIT